MLFTQCTTRYSYELLAKCRYSSFQKTVDLVRLSLGPCHKPRSRQCFYRLSIPQRPRFLQIYWAFIASRQFASQAFIFSPHDTGIIITFPRRCPMSAMTLCILKISSSILCPGAALLLVSTKMSAATGGENAFLARSRNFLCTAHARQGGK